MERGTPFFLFFFLFFIILSSKWFHAADRGTRDHLSRPFSLALTSIVSRVCLYDEIDCV